MQKFRHKLPKEDLKKFAKEVGKKLVASDFKNDRIENPTKISEKQEKKVKNYVRAYFEKAVAKKGDLDRRRKEKERGGIIKQSNEMIEVVIDMATQSQDEKDEDETIEMSPSSIQQDTTPGTPSAKRKRTESSEITGGDDLSDSVKRIKEESKDNTPSPPPPPPPPSGGSHDNCDEDHDMIDDEIAVLKIETEEELQMRLQEEELMRENEEAERMENEMGRLRT